MLTTRDNEQHDAQMNISTNRISQHLLAVLPYAESRLEDLIESFENRDHDRDDEALALGNLEKARAAVAGAIALVGEPGSQARADFVKASSPHDGLTS